MHFYKKTCRFICAKKIQPIFEKIMIFQLLFFEFCAAFCLTENSLNHCADTVGYLICTKAQERVNWLLEKTNDSMEPMRLNCIEHIRSSQRLENSKYLFSKENNDACNYASLVFEVSLPFNSDPIARQFL